MRNCVKMTKTTIHSNMNRCRQCMNKRQKSISYKTAYFQDLSSKSVHHFEPNYCKENAALKIVDMWLIYLDVTNKINAKTENAIQYSEKANVQKWARSGWRRVTQKTILSKSQFRGIHKWRQTIYSVLNQNYSPPPPLDKATRNLQQPNTYHRLGQHQCQLYPHLKTSKVHNQQNDYICKWKLLII